MQKTWLLYIELFFSETFPSILCEAEFSDEIQSKVLRVFLLAIHSHIYSFALRFLFLQTHATSYSYYSSVTVHCKGERRKTWQKTIPPSSLWFKKSLQKPPVFENSQDYAQKPQQKLSVHEFGFISQWWCVYAIMFCTRKIHERMKMTGLSHALMCYSLTGYLSNLWLFE